jgi:hypothetical protein
VQSRADRQKAQIERSLQRMGGSGAAPKSSSSMTTNARGRCSSSAAATTKGLPGTTGLAGHAIPLEARIVAVVDVFDALTSDRVYRPALSRERAVSIMREARGAQFDPAVLDGFLADLSDFATSESGRLGVPA